LNARLHAWYRATVADAELATEIVPYQRWYSRAEELGRDYAAGLPFPVVVMDDFLNLAAASTACSAFPPLSNDRWIGYIRVNERKFGMRDREILPAPIRTILDELNSDAFVELVTAITGIPGLRADHLLEGAGLHQCDRGGFLNVHTDFNVHPHRPNWRRRLNLLIYLNPVWDDAWGGQLELWDEHMERCVRRITPIFNRAVLFRTDETTFHGHPDPLECPDEVTRKAIVLYYYSEEAVAPRVRSTNHQARPSDSLTRRALIRLDKLALNIYDRTKRVVGFDDYWASRILRSLSRRRPGG
jgi:hypothetical protein